MHKSNSGLRLQSYKIDTTALQKNLKQLNEMKSEMETTISHFRMNEQYLNEQNMRLKQQISMLHKKLQQRVQHGLCSQKIKILESRLEQQKKQTIKYKEMYQIQRKNHNQLNNFYEKKMEMWKQDNNKLVEKYQQRISSLASQISVVKTNTQINATPSRKTFKSYENQNYLYPQSNDDESSSRNQKVQTFQIRSPQKTSRSIEQPKHYPPQQKKKQQYNSKTHNMIPKGPTATRNQDTKNSYGSAHDYYDLNFLNQQKKNQQKRQTPDWKSQRNVSVQTDEQVFEGSIRKLYFEIKQMGISAKQALMLPQMKKMSSNKSPSRKDLITFMKNSPIQQQNSDRAEKNTNYLEDTLRKKYGRISGNFVTQLIIQKVQEYEAAQKLNSEDISVSGLTPSLNRGDSFGMSSITQSAASKQNTDYSPNAYKKKQRPSIADALKIQSQNSIYRY